MDKALTSFSAILFLKIIIILYMDRSQLLNDRLESFWDSYGLAPFRKRIIMAFVQVATVSYPIFT